MRVHVVESGVPQPVVMAGHTFYGSVEIQADSANASDIYMGDRLVNAALRIGQQLEPGTIAHESASVLHNIYIDGATGDGVFIKQVTVAT